MKKFCREIVVAILIFESKLVLQRAQPKIVAVTGSVGKTSTKDAIYTVLKDHVHARKSEKGLNTDIGVPLTILGLRNGANNPIKWLKNIIDGFFAILHANEYPEVIVLEIGVDHPGDMKKLSAWIKPDVVVITRLPDVPSHIEFFATPEDVAAEKLQLLDSLKPDGIFVYNQDDARITEAAQGIRQKSIGYSRYSPSHFTAAGDAVVYDGGKPVGLEFKLTHLDTTAIMRVHGSIGVQHTYNYAAAAAVGSVFGIPLTDAAHALSAHTPPPGRMRILRGIKDTIIIDDSYNSSPTAMERSLQAIKELKGVKRKIAVLGDMLELGQYSVRAHENVGEDVANSVDLLLTIGVRARKIAEGALEHGMSEKHIYQYDDINRARRDIKNLIASGDVILVKASQSIRAEILVAEIMLDTDRKEELLVRHNQEWKHRKVTNIV